MRLLDILLLKGFAINNLATYEPTMKALRSAQLVVADNVAEYYSLQIIDYDKNDLTFAVTDFPNIVPPYATTFVEYKTSARSAAFKACEYAGCLVEMHNPSDFALSSKLRSDGVDVFATLLCKLFLFYRHDQKAHEVVEFIIPVLKDGSLAIKSSERQIPITGRTLEDNKFLLDDNTGKHLGFMAVEFLYSALLAFSFMHCKNVRMVDAEIKPKAARRYTEKTGKALVRYKVLEIDHLKEILRTEGKSEETGLKQALHFCRNHFRSYGVDGKGLLFGKHAGIFFVPQHTRGSIEKGVVVKDYKVK